MDLGNILNQFKDLQGTLQTQMEKMKSEVAGIFVIGQAGVAPRNVKVLVKGNKDCEKVSFGDAFSQEPKTVQEQLIAAAINDAYQKLDETMREKMGSLTGGLDLAKAFKFPFDAGSKNPPADE
jgi:nucleoid-associated protein EbfC